MKTTLPIREKKLLDDGTIEIKDSELEVDVDVSVLSQIRFESKFPELAKFEDIYDYTKRIFAIEEKDKNGKPIITAPVLISKFKAIYCWFETDLSFYDFVKLCSSGDDEYQDKLLKKIHQIANAITNGSAEKN